MTPAAIGRFRVEGVLGRGAMGVIYRAHDPAIDRPVAIKLVRADLLDGEDRAEYIERFQREAQAAGRCAHPNIVAVYDFALHEGNPYLAMEFIDGVTLQQLKDRPGGFSPAEIVSLGGQILDGLGAAHALGVVHRDIKPANIMLTSRGQVKVTDFGISRLDTSNLTGPGGVIGTPSYMSPEQCRGETTDARSDLFSVAVVLFELVTGAKPFTGSSQHEVWHKLLHEEPADSAALRPDAPAGLHDAIRRGLAKQPEARFQTAASMAATLAGGQVHPAPALSALARDADLTVVAPRPGPDTGHDIGHHPGADLGLDRTAMSTIERQLARHVGPIARLLVRDAVKGAGSVERLCETLLASVPEPAERDRFREELHSQLTASLIRSGVTTHQSSAPVAIADADLLFAQAELAHFVGPIARLLVKRAATGCAGVSQLWQRLAEHVDPGDRARFLGRMERR